MPRFSQAVLIFNPSARHLQPRPLEKLRRVLDFLTSQGINVDMAPTSGPHDASRLAQKSLAEGCELVIACGGDGTINEVIGGMAKSRVPLMIVPAGTANVLAKELGLPQDFAKSANLIKSGKIRRISLGKVNGHYFILMAGIGVDAGIIASSNARLKRLLGEGAYWIAGFQQLFRYPFPVFELTVDGQSHRGSFAVISKAKNYGGPFQITSQADLFSNQFEVCLFQAASRWRYLYYLKSVALGQHRILPDVKVLRGRKIAALGAPEVKVQVDGELMGNLPQNFSIEEDALSLVVPGD